MKINSNKAISIFAAAILLVSFISATAVMTYAQGPNNQEQAPNGEEEYNEEEVPENDYNGEEEVPENDYNGEEAQENEYNGRAGDLPGVNLPRDSGRAIGDRVRGIVGDKVEQIRNMTRDQNVSGEEIAGIAREIGVEVEHVVMEEVSHIKNRTRERMGQEEDIDERMRMQVQQARATRYDYAYSNFVTEGREKINELKERGMDVEELNQTLNEISENYLEAYRAEDPTERTQNMREKAEQFRNQFEETAGEEAEEIREQARERIPEEARQNLQGIRNEAWENVKSAALNVFDNRVEAAENKINAYQQAGFNTTEMEEALDELQELREDLENAFDEGDREQVQEVRADIREKWQEIMRAQPEDREQEYRETVNRLNRTLERTRDLTERAEEFGLDIAEAEASQEGIENGLEIAKQALDEGNYEQAKQEIENIREQFSEYREEASNLAQQVRQQMQGQPGGPGG